MDGESDLLVQQLAAGRERFLAFVQRRLADPEAAEELLQEATLRAVENMRALRSRERLAPWFYAILRNAITDFYRRRGREAVTLAPFPEDIAEDEEAETALCLCFEPLIDSLKPEYAQLLRALDLEGEPAESVARRLGLSASNLKVRRHRARRALRRRLEQTCRVCARHHCLDCTCREAPALP
jgi:RNA polymerase sigma factor (sigma-70 family)